MNGGTGTVRAEFGRKQLLDVTKENFLSVLGPFYRFAKLGSPLRPTDLWQMATGYPLINLRYFVC
jgi:hypothetical protein